MIIYIEIIFLAVLLPSAWLFVSYNLIIRDFNRLRSAWSVLNEYFKQRHELAIQLTNLVKESFHDGANKIQELKAFEESDFLYRIDDKQQIEKDIEQHLSNITSILEENQEIAQQQEIIDLRFNLSEVEKNIPTARREYNFTVRNFNMRTDSFPSNFLASFFRYRKATAFS